MWMVGEFPPAMIDVPSADQDDMKRLEKIPVSGEDNIMVLLNPGVIRLLSAALLA